MENKIELLMGRDDITKSKEEGGLLEQRAMAFQVIDEPTRTQAVDIREQARQFKKKWEAKFADAKESAHKTHKDICNLIDEIVGPAARVIKILDKKSSDYQIEFDRKQTEAQAIIDAETKRREDAEKERLLKLAVKQAENGKTEKAEETLQKAEDVKFFSPTLPGLDTSVKTAFGSSTSSHKDFTVTILNALDVITEIAKRTLPAGTATLDTKKNEIRITASSIKDYAKLHKIGDKLPDIPGCKLEAFYPQSGRSNVA